MKTLSFDQPCCTEYPLSQCTEYGSSTDVPRSLKCLKLKENKKNVTPISFFVKAFWENCKNVFNGLLHSYSAKVSAELERT